MTPVSRSPPKHLSIPKNSQNTWQRHCTTIGHHKGAFKMLHKPETKMETKKENMFAGLGSAVADDPGEDRHRGGVPLSGGGQLLLCQRPQAHQVLGTHHWRVFVHHKLSAQVLGMHHWHVFVHHKMSAILCMHHWHWHVFMHHELSAESLPHH